VATWDKFVQPLPRFLDEPPVVSNPFAWPKHKGVDLMYARPEPGVPYKPWVSERYEMWPNVPVVAVGPGDVWSVGKSRKGANVIIVDHHNVEGYGPLASMYVHLDNDIRVKKGDPVKAGTVLGFVGYTGTSLAHLHFALSTDVKKKWGVNPEALLSQWRLTTVTVSKAPVRPQVGRDLGWLIVLVAILVLSRKR
jgi:murein DD-endopeptidase MepM/ murein hydrolase activator NlpD